MTYFSDGMAVGARLASQMLVAAGFVAAVALGGCSSLPGSDQSVQTIDSAGSYHVAGPVVAKSRPNSLAATSCSRSPTGYVDSCDGIPLNGVY